MSKPLVLALGLLAGSAVLAAPPKKLVSVEGITEYALDNGMRVLLFPDASKPTVTVNVTYFVGSRHEGYGESGMAHLLEHMLFKGTPTHDKVWAEFEKHGARFNGSTWVDRTNYFETMPATAENLKFAIELEADRMVHSKIAKEDLAKEFTVVRNEFEMGENAPPQILEERMYASAYLWHNYGKSTIGSRSDIERVPIENLRAFYKRFYQPDNAMVVVAGKFAPKDALELIGASFGKLARPARVLDPTYTVEPVQDGERAVVLRRTGDVQVAGLMYHGVSGSHADFVAEEALVDLLSNKPSGRLYKALVDKGLAARLSGDAYTWAEPGMIQLFADVRGDKSAEAVRDKMIEIAEAVGRGKVGDDEVQRWKSRVLKEIELAMTDPNRIGVELSEWAATGDWRMMFVHRDRVEKLTAERVQKFAAQYLRPSNRTVGLFLPQKAPERSPLPEPVNVSALVKDYQGRAAMAEGEAFVATVENIEKRTVRATLPVGMKLALLSKKTRGGAVKLALRVHAGTESELRGKVALAQLIPQMLLRGTTRHSYQQLKDEFDRLKAEVKFDDIMRITDPSAAAVRVSTTRENLPAVLALLAEVVREPSFPAAELETLKKETLARLEEVLQDPQMLAFTELQRKAEPWPKDDVRYVPTVAEQIERVRAVKLPELAQFYKSFWGGSFAELAIVGDFDAEPTQKTLDKLFAGWKTAKAFQRIKHEFKSGVAGSEEQIKTPDKQMAFIGATHSIELRDDDADYPAMQLVNFVLGGGARSRLIERLRQKDGLSYGAFSFVQADSLDRNGKFFAGAICAPQNAVKALTALLEEVALLQKNGVPADELADAKKAYQAYFDNQLANDEFVTAQLTRLLYLDRTLAYYGKVNGKIQTLSKDELAAAARKYVAPERLVKVLAGDLK